MKKEISEAEECVELDPNTLGFQETKIRISS